MRQHVSETVTSLASLKQLVDKVGGIESRMPGVTRQLGEVNQLQNNLDSLFNCSISAILGTQGNTNMHKFSKWLILASQFVKNLGNVPYSKS